MKDEKNWFRLLLCRLGNHQSIGITVGGYIRCYCCGKDYLNKNVKWKKTGWVSHDELMEYLCQFDKNLPGGRWA